MSEENKEKTAEELAAETAAAQAETEDKDKKKAGKIKFDADQTAWVNQFANEMYGKGAAAKDAEWQKKLADEKAALQTQIDDLKKAQQKKDEQKNQPNPEVDALKAQYAELQTMLGQIKIEREDLKKKLESEAVAAQKSRKKDSWLTAVSQAKVDFFDPLEAYDLAEKDGYEWDADQNRPLVKNTQTGHVRINENGEPMSPIDFVKDFANRKKYLVKAPESAGGTGAGEQRKHESTKAPQKSFDDMTPEEFEAYTQKVMSKAR